jgi:SAM-dependent methyltransferase
MRDVKIHLKNIRLYELKSVLHFLRNKGKLLEIGSGAGWQAKYLANIGFEVTGLELHNSHYDGEREYPVIYYDGHSMPFRDNTFDIIFSSNVLEHIADIENFQAEIQRVLRPDGFAIHIMPTASWRFWTNCTYYLNAFRKASAMVSSTGGGGPIHNVNRLKKDKYWRIKYIFPTNHGPIGTSLTEIYLFTAKRWLSIFNVTGWALVNYFPSHLFYTGYSIMSNEWSLKTRHLLSYLLGSSTFIYILKKS